MAAGLLGAIPAAQAGADQAFTDLGSVQLTVTDSTFEVSGCIDVPVEANVTTYDYRTSWSISLQARLTGAAPSTSSYLYGEGTSSELDDFFVCPFEGAGVWLVSGEISLINYDTGAEATASLSTSFTLSKASTSIVLNKPKRKKPFVTVTGKVTSRSPQYGVVGAQGNIGISAQAPRSSRWIKVGSAYSSSTGVFSATIYREVATGTRFRAVFEGTDSAQRSMSSAVRL